MNKCLAESNKSWIGVKATKNCPSGLSPPETRGHAARMRHLWRQAMTLQEAKSIARHLGCTLRKVRSGDYCVKFPDGSGSMAYYTDNLEDAVNVAVAVVRKRERRIARTESGRNLPSSGA
jgi:hypothetical protein